MSDKDERRVQRDLIDTSLRAIVSRALLAGRQRSDSAVLWFRSTAWSGEYGGEK